MSGAWRMRRIVALGSAGGFWLAGVPTWADPPAGVEARVVWRAGIEYAGKSSPRIADLDRDGDPDVLVGAGFEGRWGEVVALDGATGAVLWRHRVTDDVLATEPLLDIDRDGVLDVFVAGRKLLRDALALSGRDGHVLWQLTRSNPKASFPPINFSTITLAGDRDGDGLEDLLVTQSGGEDEWRPAGRLHVVRARDGKLLASHVTPDGRECYSMPLHWQEERGGTERLFLGTGGETLSGDLFALSWPQREVLWRVRALGGGFIGSPVLTDLDEDDAREVLATTMEGSVYRLDAETGQVRWRWHERPWWTYVTPVTGNFDGAGPLDVVAAFNRGQWPRRDAARVVWLEGATGRLLDERVYTERWRWTAASPLVFDLDGDGRDEVLLVFSNPVPDPAAPAETHRLVLFDGRPGRAELLALELPGYAIATPSLGDFDGNGRLDLIHSSHYEVVRFELVLGSQPGEPGAAPPRVRWNGLRSSGPSP